MFAKLISKKWDEGRNISQVRNRTSQRIQELRRSKRSAVLNQLRQVEIPKEKKKKTAKEEKLERLKAYKAEKQKKMDELKKTQKPPFHSIVKTRHTGSTPYREPPPTRLLNKKVDKKPKSNIAGISGASSNYNNKPIIFKSNSVKPEKKQVNQNDNKDKPNVAGGLLRNTIKPMTTRNNEIKTTLKQNDAKKVVDRKKGKENKLETKQAPGVSSADTRNPVKLITTTSNPPTKNPLVQNTRPQRAVQTRRINTNPPVAKVPVKVLTDVVNTGVQTRNARKANNTTLKPGTRITRQQKEKQNSSNESTSSSEEGVTKQDEVVKRNQESKKENKQLKGESEIEGQIEEKETIATAALVESSNNDQLTNGTEFHRQRLQSTIERLTMEANIWESKKDDIASEQVKDEILAVIGQTRLLIAKRLGKFKTLIDRCECPQPEQLTITLEDLEGYWEVMYQQVDQLDQKYSNLRDLESNDWQEKVVTVVKKPTKKEGPKKKAVKPVKSQFKEFLKSKQNGINEASSATNVSVTPSRQSVKNEDTTQSSLYMSASKGEEMEFVCSSALENLKTPRTTAMQRVIGSSRRSSAALITINQRSFMKF